MASSLVTQEINSMEKQIKKQAIRYGLAAFLLALILGALIYNFGVFQTESGAPTSPIPAGHSPLLANFPSTEALRDFLKTNSRTQGPFSVYGPADLRMFSSPNTFAFAGTPLKTMAESVQHSVTNIQVAGVDEADTVKVDDNGYMYVVSNDTVYILTAYPPEHAAVLAKLKFDDMYPFGIFVLGDRLAVFGSQYSFPAYSFPLYGGFDVAVIKTFVRVYDVHDKSDPVLIKDLTLTGSYFNSRMIGDYIYFVTSKPAYMVNDALFLPEITMDKEVTEIAPTEIRYFNGTEEYYQYTTFVAMNMQNITEAPVYLTVMLGGTSNMYVSQDNMYVTFQDWYWGGNTTIYRIHMQANNMTVEAKGNIPGQEHNQFSMDEYGNYFRIQTSTWSGGVSQTNVHVLDMNLTVVGRLENLAPGENFHSARFMGNRCYLVTFKKTDPLFVIDLSNATNPLVLGELKIPGYSDYLHPYDETHLIGVGKNTVEAEEGNFAWYQGIKVSLFDVSNVTNPVQDASYVIGDRGSDTPVLSDHKAFLFDRSKNLLAIPVMVAKIDESEYPSPVPPYAYGEPVWQGAYVFDISLYHDLVLEGRITHLNIDMSINEQEYWVKRSLYIGDVLYTVSDRMVKMNSLEDLSPIGEVALS
jgi:uncharacterized secreted protein with C-terminal beta-propeller domain